jgi:hypothetical protein
MFCCDGLADCSPPLIAKTPEVACMARAVQEGAEYVTTAMIPHHDPGCFVAKSCEKQGKYKDTPSGDYILTWHRNL